MSRVTTTLAALQASVERALDERPGALDGIVFVFIVAERGVEDATWCANLPHGVAVDLMRQVVENEDARVNGLQ